MLLQDSILTVFTRIKPAGRKSQVSEMLCGKCPHFFKFQYNMMTDNKNINTFSLQSFSDDLGRNSYICIKFTAL